MRPPPAKLYLFYGSGLSASPLWEQMNSRVIQVTAIRSTGDIDSRSPAVLVLDHGLLADTSLTQWRALYPDTVFLAESRLAVDADLILSDNMPLQQSRKMLQMACELWLSRKRERESGEAAESLAGNLNKLASVGIALSSENDLEALLRKILTEGQNISQCDAASLFLVDTDAGQMTFKLTLNDSIDFPFEESRFELSVKSIAGYVALNTRPLNLADAYHIPADAVYHFNNSFDTRTGYRTISMLTLPALNKKKQVIAVLQFINRKRERKTRLNSVSDMKREVLPFDEETQILLEALAGQAGVAIENAILHHDIQRLFEGFVKASVMAIEQRDPTTSGHSFRVADLCVALAEAVNASSHEAHRACTQSDTHIRELRYAALLHDFGKVGVRESVLVKAKKLSDENIDSIRYRVLLAKEKLRNKALRQQLQMYRNGSFDAQRNQRIEVNLEQELEQLDHFFDVILESNEPMLLESSVKTDLKRIAAYCSPFERSHGFSIVTPEEFSMLSIPKGSLSNRERLEIESHVTHTRNFLQLIPWTEEFRQIPAIAGAHHEKLDGSGYPDGLSANEIPFAAKIMTICDIYDALTASDRPYKAAVPPEFALDILKREAEAGLVDSLLIDVFIDSAAYKVIESSDYAGKMEGQQRFRHHVCDFDLHETH